MEKCQLQHGGAAHTWGVCSFTAQPPPMHGEQEGEPSSWDQGSLSRNSLLQQLVLYLFYLPIRELGDAIVCKDDSLMFGQNSKSIQRKKMLITHRTNMCKNSNYAPHRAYSPMMTVQSRPSQRVSPGTCDSQGCFNSFGAC